MRMTMKDNIAKEKSDIAPRANKRGRLRTKEKKVIHEKKIKLVKALEKLLLKDDKKSISIKDQKKETTESLIGVEEQTMERIELVESLALPKKEPAKQLLDEMKAFEELLLKAKKKDATNSFLYVEEQTMGMIEHVESLTLSDSVPKKEPEASESSVLFKQVLDDMKAFEEFLLKAKEKHET